MKLRVISRFSEQILEQEVKTVLDSAETIQQTTFTTVYDQEEGKLQYTAYILYNPK